MNIRAGLGEAIAHAKGNPSAVCVGRSANIAKHGVSLALGDGLEWDSAVTWPDVRRDYGEPRQGGIGYVGLRLFFVVFVDRADGRRIISLRKANKREEKIYAST